MTGSKDFLAGENSLTFTVGRNHKRWNKVKVTLNGKDLYNMTVYRIAKMKILAEDTVNDIYAEDLQRFFTEYTGLYTRL